MKQKCENRRGVRRICKIKNVYTHTIPLTNEIPSAKNKDLVNGGYTKICFYLIISHMQVI